MPRLISLKVTDIRVEKVEYTDINLYTNQELRAHARARNLNFGTPLKSPFPTPPRCLHHLPLTSLATATRCYLHSAERGLASTAGLERVLFSSAGLVSQLLASYRHSAFAADLALSQSASCWISEADMRSVRFSRTARACASVSIDTPASCSASSLCRDCGSLRHADSVRATRVGMVRRWTHSCIRQHTLAHTSLSCIRQHASAHTW